LPNQYVIVPTKDGYEVYVVSVMGVVKRHRVCLTLTEAINEVKKAIEEEVRNGAYECV